MGTLTTSRPIEDMMRPEPKWNDDMVAIVVALGAFRTCRGRKGIWAWTFKGDPLVALCALGYVKVGTHATLTEKGWEILPLCRMAAKQAEWCEHVGH